MVSKEPLHQFCQLSTGFRSRGSEQPCSCPANQCPDFWAKAWLSSSYSQVSSLELTQIRLSPRGHHHQLCVWRRARWQQPRGSISRHVGVLVGVGSPCFFFFFCSFPFFSDGRPKGTTIVWASIPRHCSCAKKRMEQSSIRMQVTWT